MWQVSVMVNNVFNIVPINLIMFLLQNIFLVDRREINSFADLFSLYVRLCVDSGKLI